MKQTCAAVCIGLFLSAATAQEAKKEASIVGEWNGEKAVRGGKERPVPEGGVIFTFTADGKFSVNEGKRGEKDVGEYKVDAKKNPPEIDITAPKEERKMLGIYKVEGNTLTLCFSDDKDAGRPTKFESPDGSRTMLITFKRAKK